MALSRRRHSILKLRLAITASKYHLLVVVVFFALGFLYFYIAHPDWQPSLWTDATLLTFNDTIMMDRFAPVYYLIGTAVIFQGVLAVVLNRMQQASNPERMSEILAHRAVNHTIVLGYGHLGKRIYDWLAREGRSVVIVEKDAAKVQELVRWVVPVLIADASLEGVLEDANIKHAHDVVQTFNDVRTALIIAHRARTLNSKCEFHVRCHDDNVQKALERLGAKPFSTDSWTVSKLVEELPGSNAKVALIGYNGIAERLMSCFQKEHRPFMIVESDSAIVNSLEGRRLPTVKGSALDVDFLQEGGIDDCRVAVICLEYGAQEIITVVGNLLALNKKRPMLVYARIFDDEIAEVIDSMGGHTFSSSRFAFSKLMPVIRQ
jgi:Trk K+ transport system NAD-binding subunit